MQFLIRPPLEHIADLPEVFFGWSDSGRREHRLVGINEVLTRIACLVETNEYADPLPSHVGCLLPSCRYPSTGSFE